MYSCPNCKNKLILKSQFFSCLECNEKFRIVEGVPNFSKKEGYWAPFDKKIMEKLNIEAESLGWKNAMELNLPKNTIDYTLDSTRADLLTLVDINNNSNVLDLGASWGSLSTTISSHCKTLYAVDTCFETIKFLEIRSRQLGINNIKVSRSDCLKLPFNDKKFDFVILNGVLEWLGHEGSFVASTGYTFEDGNINFKKDIDPRELQILSLKEVNRVLKDNGVCITAIENRYSYVYFKGMKDDHTGVWGTNLVHRKLADYIMKIKKNTRYSTYTYSKKGYDKLFSQSFFNTNSFYGVFPTYETPKSIFPLKSNMIKFFHESQFYYKSSSKISIKNLSIDILKYVLKPIIYIFKLIIYKYWPEFMCPSFIIISKK